MTHFLLLLAFSAAVGLVLGLILRRDMGGALRVAAAIGGSMVLAALLIAWILYALPL